MVFGLFANILTVVALQKFKNLGRAPYSVLLQHLAFMDMISSACMLIMFPLKFGGDGICYTSTMGIYIFCVVLTYIPDAGTFTSFVVFMVTAIDRTIAVKYPHS